VAALRLLAVRNLTHGFPASSSVRPSLLATAYSASGKFLISQILRVLTVDPRSPSNLISPT
jgi:hypothetical protein